MSISFCHGAKVIERERKVTTETETVETKVDGKRTIMVDEKGDGKNLTPKKVDNVVAVGTTTKKTEAVEAFSECGECGQPTNPFEGTKDELADFRRENRLPVHWEKDEDSDDDEDERESS